MLSLILVLSFSIFWFSSTVIVNEKSKGKKGKLNKTKRKRKAEEISSGLVNDEDGDLREEGV